MRKIYLLVLLLPLFTLDLKAQVDRYWEVGLMFSGATYRGDLTTREVVMDEISLGFGFAGRYYVDPVFAVRGNLILATLKGDDTFTPERASRRFSFETSLVELTFMAEYEPLGMFRHMKEGPKILRILSPYVFTGAGFAFTNPQPVFPNGVDIGSFDPIDQDMKAGYSNIHLTIPFGGGLKVILDREWSLGLELGARVPFTDYLDGISQSANPDKNDWYWIGGLTILYKMQ